MPTTHDTTVFQVTWMVLYAIYGRYDINVGRISYYEIVAGRKKKTGTLFFPSLIIKLCKRAKMKTMGVNQKIRSLNAHGVHLLMDRSTKKVERHKGVEACTLRPKYEAKAESEATPAQFASSLV